MKEGKNMTWKELRSRIDRAVKKSGKKADEVSIWYLDINPDDAYMDNIEINVKDRHHPGEFELWVM